MDVPVITDVCCPPLLEGSLEREEAERLAEILKVLADPARLRILSMIADREDACVCHLTEPLGLAQPTVSHHLKVLHRAGLLEREQRGRWVHYRLAPEGLRAVRDALTPA